MQLRTLLLLLMFLGGTTYLSGQKFEIEDQVNESEVPEAAISFISECPFEGKIKWYREQSQDGTTYEAKLVFKGKVWSIEFDKEGTLLDLEMRIDFDQISENNQNKINKSLAGNFKNFTINKIQYHWEIAPSLTIDILNNFPDIVDSDLWFELVITENTKSAWKQKEVLINPEGDLVRSLEIVSRSTDNMDF